MLRPIWPGFGRCGLFSVNDWNPCRHHGACGRGCGCGCGFCRYDVAASAASVVARAAPASAITAVEWLAALPLVVEGRARLTALVISG